MDQAVTGLKYLLSAAFNQPPFLDARTALLLAAAARESTSRPVSYPCPR